jgi:hypothetical protein
MDANIIQFGSHDEPFELAGLEVIHGPKFGCGFPKFQSARQLSPWSRLPLDL